MEKVKAYDLPIRAFHWIFALLFITSFSIGNFVDDESTLYGFHMISGMVMAFMVTLRIIWGYTGTTYARFSSFLLKPHDLINYFKSIRKGEHPRELGHNPASSYAAVGMFIFTYALVSTGLLMVNGIEKKTFKEIHEIFGMLFLVTVLVHIVGVIFHQIRNHDGIPFSMITGKKNPVEGKTPIGSNSPLILVLYLMLTIGFSSYLLVNYNADQGMLHAFGKSLQLGENEHEQHHEGHN